MQDGTARLAARLARQMGKIHPWDWVAVYESHTPFEWSLQLALERAEPWGEERADLRIGFAVARLYLKDHPSASDDDLESLARSFSRYLECDAPPEEKADLQALDRMERERMEGGR